MEHAINSTSKATGPICRNCDFELSSADARLRNAAGEYLCDACYELEKNLRLEQEIAELRRANSVLVAALDRYVEAQRVALDELEEIAA